MLHSLRAAAAVLAVSGLALTATPAALGANPSVADATATFQAPTGELARAPIDADGNWKVLVAYRDGIVPADALDMLDTLGVVRGIELPTIGAVAVTAPLAVVQAIPALDARVAAVRPQGRVQFDLYASVEQINGRGVDEAETFRRPYFDQGGIEGSATFERPGVTGAGVNVGIIDTGIAIAHPDFDGRLVAGLNFNLSELQDEGGISFEEWDAYAEGTGELAYVDEVGHGTHVASTVGGDGSLAVDQGADEDLRGLAPAVGFISMKIASPASGVVDDLEFEEAALAALDYTRRHAEGLNIRVVNNSWGILPAEPSTVPGIGEESDYAGMALMVQSVWDAGVTLVFSAGNDGPEPGTIRAAPGGLDAGITVAAACKVDGSCAPGEITGFSSRGIEDGTGNQADIAAPGDTIMAALSPSVLAPPPLNQCPTTAPAGYFCISGTSMAAPHIAGVAALMAEAFPGITPAQTKQCMTTTADDLLEPGKDIHSGWGMVNTRAALICAYELSGPEPVSIALPSSAPAPEPAPLPVTGGGLALLGLGVAAAANGLRRR